MKKKINFLSWLIPSIFLLIAISTMAYNGGVKLENHSIRITTLEENIKTIQIINTKIDSLLRRK